MPEKSGSPAGVVAGVFLGVVLIGGIAGTPFYLSGLQSDQRALDAAVHDDIETIRRTVLNMDSRLSAMSSVYDSAGGDSGPDGAAMRTLLAENAKMLDWAEQAVRKFANLRRGTALAGAHLAVNHIEAVLYLATAKIDSNRAALEDALACASWREAERRSAGVATLRGRAELARARQPSALLSGSRERAQQLGAALDEQQALLSKLKRLVVEKEDQIAGLDTAATEARRTLAGLDEQGLSSSAYRSAYLDFSNTAREAEAAAAFLRSGRPEGIAQLSRKSDDPLGIHREWAAEMCVRDLEFGVALLEGQITSAVQMQGDLANREEILERLTAEFGAEESKLRARLRSLRSETDDLLGKADQHLESAQKARLDELKALERAGNYVGQAIIAAKRRTTAASTTLRESGRAEDELLQRISRDGDIEAALLCLKAEIAYNSALSRLGQMSALQAKHQAESLIGEALGQGGPADIAGVLDSHRGEAAKELATATESLDTARNRMKGTNVRASDGTSISGSNYLWQIDVGQAAVRLLQANLAANRMQREEAQTQAYELLTQAAQGREQSPLLGPAIDALLYLQRSAR